MDQLHKWTPGNCYLRGFVVKLNGRAYVASGKYNAAYPESRVSWCIQVLPLLFHSSVGPYPHLRSASICLNLLCTFLCQLFSTSSSLAWSFLRLPAVVGCSLPFNGLQVLPTAHLLTSVPSLEQLQLLTSARISPISVLLLVQLVLMLVQVICIQRTTYWKPMAVRPRRRYLRFSSLAFCPRIFCAAIVSPGFCPLGKQRFTLFSLVSSRSISWSPTLTFTSGCTCAV